ncbi:MAG: succinate dehydrogenase, cytochrome b556 subunit [Micavibrio sp.]
MSIKTRPLSPHLQVYRLPMTALMSITHRITGAILAGGFLLIAGILMAAAAGASSFNAVMDFAGSPFGTFIIVGWAAALYYHMLNGIRHLVWDAKPATVTKPKAEISGWIILIATALLTAGTLFIAL